jgi:hypothetical protein
MRTLLVVVTEVLAKDSFEVAMSHYEDQSRHSVRTVLTQRSANALVRGRTLGSKASTAACATSTSTVSSSTASLRPRCSPKDWRIDYNMNRPHSAHGWLTPVEFVEASLHRPEHQLA